MDVEIEHPHHHHHRPTGVNWLDLALPLAALVVSVVSIIIALHHGEVMQSLVRQNERLVQANSLPYVTLDSSNLTATGEPLISLSAINKGVGPADIRSVQIMVDGRPVPNLAALLKACCGTGNSPVLISTLLGSMVRAGEEISYIKILVTPESKEDAKRFDKALQSKRIVTEICYCSVFNECWTRSSRPFDRPMPVRSCPMPQPQYVT